MAIKEKIMNIEDLQKGDTIEFKKEPVSGMGLVFKYNGSFVIGDSTMYAISKGVFMYNLSTQKIKECL